MTEELSAVMRYAHRKQLLLSVAIIALITKKQKKKNKENQ